MDARTLDCNRFVGWFRWKGRIDMPVTSPHAPPELNHGQKISLERIEIAVGELASVLLCNCRSDTVVVKAAIANIRKAVGPVITTVLSAQL